MVLGITNTKINQVLAYYATNALKATDIVLILMDVMVKLQTKTSALVKSITGMCTHRSTGGCLPGGVEDKIISPKNYAIVLGARFRPLGAFTIAIQCKTICMIVCIVLNIYVK